MVISLLGLGCCFSVGNRDGHQCIGSVLALEEVCTTEDTEDTEKKGKGRPFAVRIDPESGCRIVVGRTQGSSSPLPSCLGALRVLCGVIPKQQSYGGVAAIRFGPRKNHHRGRRGHEGNTKGQHLAKAANDTHPEED